MFIETIEVTDLCQNCRIVGDPESLKAAVIDPGGHVDRVLDSVKREDWSVELVLLTHAHLDHCGGVAALLMALEERQGFRPQLLGHKAEKEMRAKVTAQAEMFGLGSEYANCPEPDIYIDEGYSVTVGQLRGLAYFTPGHSPGHLIYYFARDTIGQLKLVEEGTAKQLSNPPPVCFSGDALFAGSIGRTDLPGGNAKQLMDSIKSKILTLPDDTLVLSGHGPITTIGREKRSNPFLVGAGGWL